MWYHRLAVNVLTRSMLKGREGKVAERWAYYCPVTGRGRSRRKWVEWLWPSNWWQLVHEKKCYNGELSIEDEYSNKSCYFILTFIGLLILSNYFWLEFWFKCIFHTYYFTLIFPVCLVTLKHPCPHLTNFNKSHSICFRVWYDLWVQFGIKATPSPAVHLMIRL